MFLLEPSVRPWDLAILLLLETSFCTMLASLIVRHMLPRARRAARGLLLILALAGCLAFLTVLYGSFVEPHLLVVTRHDVAFPARLRVAVVSDLHVGPYKGKPYVERVVAKTNAEKPDIILLAGDFVFTESASRSLVDDLDPLRDLHAPLGVFAVLGNHDLGHTDGDAVDRSKTIIAALESFGVRVLRDTHATVTLADGTRVALAGVNDPVGGQMYHVSRALRGIPTATPVILASHSPDVILNPDSRRAQLIVAGHTHGGQIRLPFLGPLTRIPDRLGNRYDQGVFPIGTGSLLAITRGAGESSVRARLFAWPEVMVLGLRP
jgi:predicted MPP superfamily phosphohydrolase